MVVRKPTHKNCWLDFQDNIIFLPLKNVSTFPRPKSKFKSKYQLLGLWTMVGHCDRPLKFNHPKRKIRIPCQFSMVYCLDWMMGDLSKISTRGWCTWSNDFSVLATRESYLISTKTTLSCKTVFPMLLFPAFWVHSLRKELEDLLLQFQAFDFVWTSKYTPVN